MRTVLALATLLTSVSLQAITIGAYNIRNFDYDDRARIFTDKPQLSTILKSLNADVLSVEEINNTTEFEKFITTNMPTYKVALTACGGAHGQRLGFIYNTETITLLSFNQDLTIANPGRQAACDSGSRPLAIGLFEIKGNKQKFYGMTAHLKSGSTPDSLVKRSEQYDVIKKTIKELKSKTGVNDYYLAGDLNTTEYLKKGSDYVQLTKVVKDLGMIDLSEKAPCSAYWWGGTDDGIEEPSLLDHVIVTPGLLKTKNIAQVGGHCKKVSCKSATVQDLGVSYEGVSDHCPITAKIQ